MEEEGRAFLITCYVKGIMLDVGTEEGIKNKGLVPAYT